jgi:branched-chain amino acid transport system permease protein
MSPRWYDMPPRGRVLSAVIIAALLVAPLIADRYLVSVLILIFYFAYLGQAWNLMMGFAGQLSLGHALYVGVGAYVAALLWVYFGIGPWLGIFPAVAVAALFGAAIGWLGFRFSIEGVYFALLTIAFAEFTRIAFDNISLVGGAGGFFVPYQAERLGEWWNLRGGPLIFYYLGLVLAIGSVIFTAYISRSRLGYHWLAVREDQQAARALGIDVFRAKMQAVLISSAMTAIGGVFYAFYYNTLFPLQMFGIGRSIELVLAPIVGGIGTIFGPVVGAFVLTPLGEVLTAAVERHGANAPGAKALFYGLTLMVIIFVRPDGIWPWLARVCGLADRRRTGERGTPGAGR